MFLSKIRLERGGAGIWENSTYSVHQLIWTWFSRGPDDKRKFLYRVDEQQGGVQILALSDEPPVRLNGWHAETRVYMPTLRVGDQLAFSLRANATVMRGGRRHDVVMDLKHRLHSSQENVPSSADLIQQALSEWLGARSGPGGFQLVEGSIRADGYQRIHFFRKGGEIDFHQVDTQGVLRVEDPNKLLPLLYQGIGRAKGFGCGLFLVRRA